MKLGPIKWIVLSLLFLVCVIVTWVVIYYWDIPNADDAEEREKICRYLHSHFDLAYAESDPAHRVLFGSAGSRETTVLIFGAISTEKQNEIIGSLREFKASQKTKPITIEFYLRQDSPAEEGDLTRSESIK